MFLIIKNPQTKKKHHSKNSIATNYDLLSIQRSGKNRSQLPAAHSESSVIRRTAADRRKRDTDESPRSETAANVHRRRRVIRLLYTIFIEDARPGRDPRRLIRSRDIVHRVYIERKRGSCRAGGGNFAAAAG